MTEQTHRLCIALPAKGILERETRTFLEECSLSVIRSDRELFGHIKALPEAEIVFQHVEDMATLVQSGAATFAITGEDVLLEYQSGIASDEQSLLLLRHLGYGKGKLVIAVPETWDEVSTLVDLGSKAEMLPHRLRIATKYPVITQNFWRHHRLPPCEIKVWHGAIEATPRIGIADIISDLTATGKTLRANGLKQLGDGVLLDSQACFIAHAKGLQGNQQARQIATQMLKLIDACLQTRNAAQLATNMRQAAYASCVNDER